MSGLPSLVAPFAFTQVLYWYLFYIPATNPSLKALVIKCLPVLSLFSYSVSVEPNRKNEALKSFVNLMSAGLLFSVVGDAFLVYDQYMFVYGMAAFAVAQMSYVTAFGLSPLRLGLLACLAVPAALYVRFILSSVDDPLLSAAMPLYGALLVAMCWRAISHKDGLIAKKGSLPSWLPGLGGVLFVLSDAIIVFDKFYTPVDNAQQLIMSTYYAAQFLLTTSLVGLDAN